MKEVVKNISSEEHEKKNNIVRMEREGESEKIVEAERGGNMWVNNNNDFSIHSVQSFVFFLDFFFPSILSI